MTGLVETIQLAPGLRIARVLNGLWQIADSERAVALDAVATAQAMAPYVEAGFTTFDMADHYGSAEVIAGTFRRQHARGGEAQLLTKWVPAPGPVSRNAVREAVDRALQRMQGERVDLLQFHAWHYPDPSWLDALFFLDELRAEGLIRHLGVTNFDTAHLRIALSSGIPIVSNQLSYSLLDRRAGGSMTALCEEFGVKLLAYGTLAGGLLSEAWVDAPEPQSLSTWSQMKYKRFIDAVGGWAPFQRVLSAVAQVARRHGVSMPVVASRYMLDQPAVGGVIMGARLNGKSHVEENLAIFRCSLDAQDHAVMDSVLATLDPVPGDCGDEYRKAPYLTAAGDLSDHFNTIPPSIAPRRGEDGRVRVFSGTPWEPLAGYCRAVREGAQISVSGTTATHGERLIGGGDPAAQTHFVIDKIEAAISALGGRLEDVVRTRVFVNDIADWEPVARAHGLRFGSICPANTLVEARLVGIGYKVEIEADAWVRR
ncbi:MAG: aldo/keto reductase [Pseudomonadota bacterium]